MRHPHTFLALLLAFAIAACVVGALAKGSPAACGDLLALDRKQAAGMLPLFLLMPWAFLGFESIVHVADNLAFPRRRLFAVMASAILATACCYIGLTVLAVQQVPEGFACWQDYIASLAGQEGPAAIPTFFAMQASFGRAGLVLLLTAVLAALGTSLLGFLIASAQLVCSLAESGVLPEALGRRSEDDLPENAMLLVLCLCMTAPFLGRTVIEWFMPVINLGATLAFGYTSASAYAQAIAEGRPLARLAGGAGTVLAASLALVLLVPTSWEGTADPESHLFLALWSVLGLLVFRYVARRGGGAGGRGRSPLVWMALFFLIFYCSAMWMRQAGQNAARAACGDIAGYYEAQLQALSGHARGAGQAAADQQELESQMHKVVDQLFAKQLLQCGIVLCALWLLYGIFRAMRARERRLEMEKMRAEERSRAKSAFLFNMSHDLRTPMNAIIGYADLARRRRVSGEEMRGYLDKIGDASQHLLALINDTLEMSHIENGKLELTPVDTDLRASAEEVCALFAAQLEEKGVRFDVDCTDLAHPFVKCDGNHFRRVVLNLVGNAAKFTPAGGNVRVRLAQTGGGGDAGRYELEVRDTGIGMSPEFAARVFEAFEQERSST